MAARALLLRSFDIVAIAEFGSGTFGRTGTNTVALFLRRKAIGPETAAHYEERVAEWFKGTDNDKRRQVAYKDAPLLDRYAAHISIPSPDYKTLLCGAPNAALLAHETFLAYRRTFDSSTETKGLATKGWFKRLTNAEKQAELAKRFLAYVQTVERDKLLHFVLADQQPGPVLIMRCPTDTKEQKRFLGYEWSGAKGDEGIKLFKDADGRHLTPLYDETDRDNPAKINHAIAQNFLEKLTAVPAELENHLSLVPLAELLDFSRVSFEKQIALGAKRTVVVQSKWPIRRIEEVCVINPSKDVLRALPDGTAVSFVDMAAVSDDGRIQKTEVRPIEELRRGSYTYFADGDVILAKITPCMENGKCALAASLSNGIALGSSEFHVLRADPAKLLNAYLFAFLNRDEIREIAADNMTGSSGHRRVPESFYASMPLPLPTLDTQRTIVAECEAVDAETAKAQAEIEQAQQEIAAKVNAVYASKAPREEIAKLSTAVQYGLNEPMNETRIGFKIFRMNEIVDGRMADGGAMKYAAITPEVFADYRLHRGDVLFNRTNSIEHVGKTGLFDLEGDYCFASYLIRIVPDRAKVLPLFLTRMMNAAEWQAEAKSKAAKAINQANINAGVMKALRVPVPPLKEQERFVQAVEALESQIATARALLRTAPARKEAILKEHL